VHERIAWSAEANRCKSGLGDKENLGIWAKKWPATYPYVAGLCFLSYPKTPR
jgi:hypothetical protein